MQVTILGHSYVRDLSRLGHKKLRIEALADVSVSYEAFPGIKFSHFLESPELLEGVFALQPDFLVVILGGNDFDNFTSLDEVKSSAETFYRLLRENLPNTKIFATQVETRFYKTGNKFGCPVGDLYKYITNYFNKKLRKLPGVDNLICVLGPGRLSNRELFKEDGVHLKVKGLHKLWDIIKTFLYKKILEN